MSQLEVLQLLNLTEQYSTVVVGSRLATPWRGDPNGNITNAVSLLYHKEYRGNTY